MDFKKVLKKNTIIRRLGKKFNIYKAFSNDAREFSKYYVEEAERNGDFRYSVMLLVHSLEKGMCMPNPRPFGEEKIHKLMEYLKNMELSNSNNFEYKLGVSVLNAWIIFFEKHSWTSESTYKTVKAFIEQRTKVNIQTGAKEYIAPPTLDLSEKYFALISTRHSVRDFKTDKLDMKDVQFAIECFIETPTACNRQMCGLMYIEKPEVKCLLDKKIIGLPGFNKGATQYFIITYDLAAFAYSGERQQGLFNAGLCAMNFINGLHAKGIGSCCLQWSNKSSEDREVRKALNLRESERIGIVVGCGYYKERNIIPCSVRKTKDEVFKII